MPSWSYEPSRKPIAKVQRRVVQWRRACQANVAPDRPIVTFTFDDFPPGRKVYFALIFCRYGV